jgi:hypothetical protein
MVSIWYIHKLKKILSNEEIADLLLKRTGVENDNQLAGLLGVERQQINQFRKTRGGQITHKMLSLLLQPDNQ